MSTLFCHLCKTNKSIDEFYQNQAGSKARCKLCVKNFGNSRRHKLKVKAERAERAQVAILTFLEAAQSNKEPFVYLLKSHNRYKIGYSTEIINRVNTFNTASPFPIEIIAIAPGDADLEAELHREFSELRIFREWFLAKPQIVKRFKKLPDSMVFMEGYIKA